MAQLSSPERVLRSINGQEIDRIPCYFRAEQPLCLKIEQELHLPDYTAIARYFGSDALPVAVRCQDALSITVLDDHHYLDAFGNRFYHTDNCARVDRPALAPEGELLPIDSICWPDGAAILDVEACVTAAKTVRESGLAVYGGAWASLFTRCRELLGEETFFIAMMEEPEYVKALVDRVTDFYLDMNKAYLDLCRPYIDVYYFGIDLGTQRGLFISKEHFQTFFKENMTRVTKQAKEYGLPVMFHSCGSVAEIIPDLIDCGIDILDPVQVCAAGMEPASLAKYRGQIGFHGGISTQTTLPFGTPQEVAEQTQSLIELLGPNRLIVSPDQDMLGEIPLENVKALFDTVAAYRVR